MIAGWLTSIAITWRKYSWEMILSKWLVVSLKFQITPAHPKSGRPNTL